MRTPLLNKSLILGMTLASLATAATTAHAGHARAQLSAQANVRVWVEGGDVFSNYGDVAVWLRPERDCYTTLFMVDTDGYMHVLYPGSPYDDTWLYGGRSYCYRASDLGLDRLDGAGIAYVFAVGSPEPFDYSTYGASVFVGGFGFRVYGDPFVASRDFYMTLLPASCRWDYVGVSYARFYVRTWARYPSYLCYGGPGVHVRVGDGCRSCGDVYISYRSSCARPWDSFRPVPKFKHASGHFDRYSDDRDDDRAYSRTSRVERVQRESFKSKSVNRTTQRESFKSKSVNRTTQREYGHTAKQLAKPSQRAEHVARVTKDTRVVKRSAARVETRATSGSTKMKSATKSPERARVVSTSSARARASVDRADVSAMTRHSKQAVRVVRDDERSKRAESAQKSVRTAATRDKGNKKKQAR